MTYDNSLRVVTCDKRRNKSVGISHYNFCFDSIKMKTVIVSTFFLNVTSISRSDISWVSEQATPSL